MPFPICGRTPNNYVMDVDASGYAFTKTNTDPTLVGYTKVCDQYGVPGKHTADGYRLTSIEDHLFYDMTEGATIDTNKWLQSASGMTITAANGFYNLNPTNVTTAGAYAILTSIQTFQLSHCQPLHLHFNMASSLMDLPANTVIEVGIGLAATNAAPTDGIMWRVRNSAMYSVMNNAGAEDERQISPSPFALPSPNTTYDCIMNFYADKYRLFIGGTLFAAYNMPTSWSSIIASGRLPVFLRVYNTGSAPASSPTLKFGAGSVSHRNANTNRTLDEIQGSMGFGGYQSPVTPYLQTQYCTNNTEPVTIAVGSLSNTALGNAAYNTLGGDFAFNAPATSANDYIIFGWQNTSGRQYVLCGFILSATNIGAAPATTPTVLRWGLGINSSGLSLATAESPASGTWAPRRIAIGEMGFPIAQLIGSPAQVFTVSDLGGRKYIDSNRYLHLFVRPVVGTATASQLIRGNFTPIGYFR